MSTVHPHSFAVAVATAGAVEAHLRVSMHERDLRMRSRYHDLVEEGRDPRALVMESGRVIASSPEGWTGPERMSCRAGAARSRCPRARTRSRSRSTATGAYLVRRLELGPGLAPRRARPAAAGPRAVRSARRARAAAAPPPGGDPRAPVPAAGGLHHRRAWDRPLRRRGVELERPRRGIAAAQARRADLLRALPADQPVESDVGRVQAMLRRGAVREAAEHYTGPLLALSDAPGVVRLRDELDGWLRHAVMTGGDREALWAWVQSPAGTDDPARGSTRSRGWTSTIRGAARPPPSSGGCESTARERRRPTTCAPPWPRRAGSTRSTSATGSSPTGRDEWRASSAGSICRRPPRPLRARRRRLGRLLLLRVRAPRRARVVALDGPAWQEPAWGPGGSGTKAGFELARRALGSARRGRRARARRDLARDGRPLRRRAVPRRALPPPAPVAGARAGARVCDGLLILETHADLLDLRRPAMALYPGDEVAGDGSNWWGPNLTALTRDAARGGVRACRGRAPRAAALPARPRRLPPRYADRGSGRSRGRVVIVPSASRFCRSP